ncbi:MAG: DUF411 domain-containing protein [Gammaproteobacteria bacterium]|nr:DUF411 domain-containing protein [Gammaproteobacteria bacterium]
MNHRRIFIAQVSALLVVGPACVLAEETGPLVRVYKSPTCNCCKKWIRHLQDAGFRVEATDVSDIGAYKIEYGVPRALGSCHTAIVDGYIVEGHVPADNVIKMLRQKPEIIGIAAPGMPMGSPGMEGPNAEAYDVIAFDADGKTSVFDTHTP